jgi:hypothetical protein
VHFLKQHLPFLKGILQDGHHGLFPRNIPLNGHPADDLPGRAPDRREADVHEEFPPVLAVVDEFDPNRLPLFECGPQPVEFFTPGARPLQDARRLTDDFRPRVAVMRSKASLT